MTTDQRFREEAEKKIREEMKTDYPLIPMSQITDEARILAVAWVDGYESQGMDIPGKQKLASDIMNYARRQATSATEFERERAKGLAETMELIKKMTNSSPIRIAINNALNNYSTTGDGKIKNQNDG